MSAIAFLEVNVNEINQMSPEALQKFAEKQSAQILGKIEDSVRQINEFQNKSIDSSELEGLEHFKNFISGGNYKRDKDQSALRSSLESMRADSGAAMLSMVNLIQESVKFTCTSIKLAQCMHSTMAVMMAKGFKDSDGNLHELDENTQEFVKYIINQADMFVTNQAEFDQRIESLEQFKTDVENIERDQDIRIDKAIKAGEENAEKLESLSKKETSHEKQIKEQAEKGKERDRRLSAAESKDKEHEEALGKQMQKDLEHDAAIKAGKEKDAEQDKLLEESKLKDKEQDAAIKAGEEKDVEQDRLLEESKQKDQEHDAAIKAGEEKDAEQDRRLEEQTLKNEEHDKLLKTQLEKDIEHDKAIEAAERKVAEQERLLKELSEKGAGRDKAIENIERRGIELDSLIHERVIKEQNDNMGLLEKRIKDDEKVIDSQKEEICKLLDKVEALTTTINEIKENYGSKKQIVIAYGIAIASLVIAIIGILF